MLRALRLNASEMRNTIFVYAIINCIAYIVLLLSCKYLNVLHITGLRMLNYVLFTFISFYQLHHLIKKYKGYLPFLQVYMISLFTGAASFFLFAVFIFFYTWFDPYLNDLYLDVSDSNRFIPALLIFFEGTGGSIIVAFIVMKYANRYADGEIEV